MDGKDTKLSNVMNVLAKNEKTLKGTILKMNEDQQQSESELKINSNNI